MDYGELMSRIEDVIIKTLIAAEPSPRQPMVPQAMPHEALLIYGISMVYLWLISDLQMETPKMMISKLDPKLRPQIVNTWHQAGDLTWVQQEFPD